MTSSEALHRTDSDTIRGLMIGMQELLGGVQGCLDMQMTVARVQMTLALASPPSHVSFSEHKVWFFIRWGGERCDLQLTYLLST